jgi:hypothetical protein
VTKALIDQMAENPAGGWRIGHIAKVAMSTELHVILPVEGVPITRSPNLENGKF